MCGNNCKCKKQPVKGLELKAIELFLEEYGILGSWETVKESYLVKVKQFEEKAHE